MGVIIFAIVFYGINSFFAFYTIGINPRLMLPLGLNAPIAFMAYIGFPLILSIIFYKDVVGNNKIKISSLIVLLIVIGVASVSMGSRASMVMLALPIVIASSYVVSKRNTLGYSKTPFIYVGIFLVLILALVSAFRIIVFSEGSLSDNSLLISYAIESFFLVVDRWIGAEAIMVAVSEPNASVGLFVDILLDNPKAGVNTLYQELSGGKYEYFEKFIFLTLPGFFGIISFSGSLLLAFMATFAVSFAGVAYEHFIKFCLCKQQIGTALAAAALANSIAQMNFAVLLFSFVFQLTVFLLFVRFFILKDSGFKLT